MIKTTTVCALAAALSSASPGSGPGAAPRAGAAAEEAFLSPTFDAEAGRVTLRLPPADADGVHVECLHLVGIETGLGANDVGLDRGQMRGARLVRFRRLGSRVALELVNLGFRADGAPEAESAAVAQSFATSVLFAAEPDARDGSGAVTLDITPLLTRDLHGIAAALAGSGQGSYSVDAARSAPLVRDCAAFPRNVELGAALTFTSSSPGRLARATAPDGGALTFVQRQSFLALPDDGYERRPFHPRMGAFAVSYEDLATPLDADLTRRFAVRHRLSADAPLVYYVDRGAPGPVRSALVEGASWWAEAFEAAGFPGAFRVEVAPEGLDPLDARHNVIQWVHRSTRGWSYGNAVTDPRTGEILKGHVSLGSLRVRQDRLLFEGLVGVGRTGTGEPGDPVEVALARIRQLAAHEVGHTLGLSHNFAASAAGRASVMDYPAPRVRLTGDGRIDLSDAYDVGIGEWDEHAIRMLYEEPGAGEDAAELQRRLDAEARAAGLEFLTDADARAAGAAHPRANLWDDGADPIAGLEHALDVRAAALARFGRDRIRAGAPLARLEEVLVPLYLHHRYQVDAAVKSIGGVDYEHATNEAGMQGARAVPAADQRRAVRALARAIAPETLRLPDGVAALMLPRPPGHGSSRETFERSATSPAFDVLGAADVAARTVLAGMLQRQRLARVASQSALEAAPAFESLDAYLGEVLAAAGLPAEGAGPASPADLALRRVARVAFVEEALAVYLDARAAAPVRESLRAALGIARARLSNLGMSESASRVQAALERGRAPDDAAPAAGAPGVPPGSPIGAGAWGCPGCGW